MRAIFIFICKGVFLGNVFSFLHVRCTALLHVCSDYERFSFDRFGLNRKGGSAKKKSFS